MASEVANDELDGFSASARRAMARAESEAHHLGHDRVGTEHLLLGLIAEDDHRGPTGSTAADALRTEGVTFAAARHKVREATAVTPRRHAHLLTNLAISVNPAKPPI